MKKAFKIITLSVCVTLLVLSCKKESTPPINTDNQEISNLKSKTIFEDGVMKFRDNEHFSEFFKLSFDELASLEKTFGYISYDSKIDQVLEELDLISTKSEFKSFKKKYQNYMTTRIRDNEESYECIVPPTTYSLIANENGLYFVGDMAYRVVGEYILSSEIKDVRNLLKIGYDDLESQAISHGLKAKKYIEIQELSNSLKSTSGYLGGTLSADKTNPAGNRKVFLDAIAWVKALPGGQQYYVNLSAKGQKKSWLVGWRDYKTSIYIYGADSGADVVVSTPYWGTQSFYVGTHSISNSKRLTVQLFNQIQMMSGNGDPIYFTKVKVRAYTGGTGSGCYAEIDKQ